MWAVEVRRRGIQPNRFATKQEAEMFAGATYPWLGLAWRVVYVKEPPRANTKPEPKK